MNHVVSMAFWLISQLSPQLLTQPETHTHQSISQQIATKHQIASTPTAPQIQAAPKPKINLLDDVANLRLAKQSLIALPEFEGKPLFVYNKIDFFDGTRPRIEVSLRHPKLNGALVFYTFENGKWTQGEAEDISHIKNPQRSFTPLDDVDFEQVAKIAQIWREKAKEVKAVEQEPYHIAFIWLPARNKRFWHTATLEAHAKRFYLSTHFDGTIWEFNGLSGATADEN